MLDLLLGRRLSGVATQKPESDLIQLSTYKVLKIKTGPDGMQESRAAGIVNLPVTQRIAIRSQVETLPIARLPAP
jgi:hypothetical protein